MREWSEDEQSIQEALARLEQPAPQHFLTAQRTLELAHKAYSLYLTHNPAEQAQLLQIVLLNCAIDGASIRPTYKKPFDLIFERAKTEDWSGRADLNCPNGLLCNAPRNSFSVHPLRGCNFPLGCFVGRLVECELGARG